MYIGRFARPNARIATLTAMSEKVLRMTSGAMRCWLKCGMSQVWLDREKLHRSFSGVGHRL